MFLKAGIAPLIMEWEDSLGKGINTIARFHSDSNSKVESLCSQTIIIAFYLVKSLPMSV